MVEKRKQMDKQTLENRKRGTRLIDSIRKNFWLYIFILPTLVWLIVFHYVPMGGIVIAFKRYTGARSIWESPWVGLKWFKSFFSSRYAPITIRNTLMLSLYSMLAFPIPIAIALVLNELRNEKFKKVVQTTIYAPHFISTVVVISMVTLFFDVDFGIVNLIAERLGGARRSFLTEAKSFRHLYVWSGVWQNMGWECIIYLAALSSIDPQLHEAAIIDGASRFQRIIHINLPTILPTIIIMLILSVGGIMSVGADKVLLLKNDLNSETAETISTFVYKRGLLGGDFSYSTAVGLFTNVVNLILLLTVNKISSAVSETSLF